MKLIPSLLAVIGLAGGIASFTANQEQVLILTGDTRGYLAPCGCTEPMIGGLRRRAAAIRSLSEPGRTTILDNGAFVNGIGRQDQIKAETVAQILAQVGVDAINVAPEDARLGSGYLSQVGSLAGGKLTSLSIADPAAHSVTDLIEDGPFLIGGASSAATSLAAPLGAAPVRIRDAVKTLADAAASSGKAAVLMLQGTHEDAVSLAREFPSLALIQYSSSGTPPSSLETVGQTALVTSGDHGKYVIRIGFADGKFQGYRATPLGPEWKNDPDASRIYDTYLKRVREEKLLDKLPRKPTASYAGSWSCMPCHEQATKVWKGSHHRLALETLIREKHDADPDCVSCHVVALSSTKGFVSKARTPALAGVGCESCHGPAHAHASSPKLVKMPRITQKSCVGCHNPENSPNFRFDVYWKQIKH